MAQESVAQVTVSTNDHEQHEKRNLLGPILCWAVVFADIGTSVYYTPGILYSTAHIGTLAGFFVFLTMSVFVLLTLKYAEVTHRFPQGGGVVTVAATAITRWAGALGGMFILVDYFLTAAISCLSGMLYLSVVFPAIGPYALFITIGALVLLGILNWVGISESAKVSLVGAVIAFASDIAILVTVFTHISLAQFFALFPLMFKGHVLTLPVLLAGFAGSFLAFSGLESISQLSPVMRSPRKKVAGIALLLVVLTIGITSPVLTMLSTILQPHAADDPTLNAQLISLLAGHWGGVWGNILQTEVAISASALLVFASNTAIIGAYHVFMALSNMEFLPSFVLKRNKLRGTPHYSIMLATVIPIMVLIAVLGNINILGDMYAFGLLGAFSLTCLSLDIVRFREWRFAKRKKGVNGNIVAKVAGPEHHNGAVHEASNGHTPLTQGTPEQSVLNGHQTEPTSIAPSQEVAQKETHGLWFKIDFVLGVITTLLVITAWSTNLINKPLATGFGGGITLLGLLIAYINYRYQRSKGRVPVPVVVTRVDHRIPDSILAILSPGTEQNNAVIQAAVNSARDAHDKPLIFLYVGHPIPRPNAPRMLEIVDPYLEDPFAKEYFGKAESLALKAKIPSRHFVYLQDKPDIVAHAWQVIHPHDTVVASKGDAQLKDINPDRIRYEVTPEGKVAHLLKSWAPA
jgi:amino acid transporter